MFSCFHQNKFRYEKGQIAPLLILVMVILIIMAMATVNLSKVSTDKTNSANSVDAGGLAAGSVMANVFNGIAVSNSQLEASYWEFFASVSVAFALANMNLSKASTAAAEASASAASAAGSACGSPCSAAKTASKAAKSATQAAASVSKLMTDIKSIRVAVIAFTIAQEYFYLNIRKMAEEGRDNAVKMGHRFSFINAGISTRLPNVITEGTSWNKSRKDFSRFIDGLESEESYQFEWKDGQNRQHFVKSKVEIDPVDTFALKVTVLPMPAEVALLTRILSYATIAKTALESAAKSYSSAAGLLSTACRCKMCCKPDNPGCCACKNLYCAKGAAALKSGISANQQAITSLSSIPGLLIASLAGLLPGPTLTDSSGALGAIWPICWIEDVIHNRKVKVDSWQGHGQLDIGFWRFLYPQIHSFSKIDFTGQGQIHAPDPRHDASIIQTDKIGGQTVNEGEQNASQE
ncbi:MAG: Tad domain-containing protein [Candidatus Omnitrophota bacterium]